MVAGLGVPELMAFLGYAIGIAVWVAVGYVVVKKAVKNAILEAHEKIASEKQHAADGR